MTGRTDRTNHAAVLRSRRLVRLLTPEPQRPADRREDRGDRRLVQAGMLTRPGHSGPSFPLAEILCDLPDAPAENRVTPIDDPHVSPFTSSLPTVYVQIRRRQHTTKASGELTRAGMRSTTARAERRNRSNPSRASSITRAEARPRLAGSANQPQRCRGEGGGTWGNHGFPHEMNPGARGRHGPGVGTRARPPGETPAGGISCAGLRLVRRRRAGIEGAGELVAL